MYLKILSERETALKKLPILIPSLSNEIIYSTIKFEIYLHEKKCIIYTVKGNNCSSNNSNSTNNVSIHKMYFPLQPQEKKNVTLAYREKRALIKHIFPFYMPTVLCHRSVQLIFFPIGLSRHFQTAHIPQTLISIKIKN